LSIQTVGKKTSFRRDCDSTPQGVQSKVISQESKGMKGIKTYRDLIVWQKAHELAKRVINILHHYPSNEEAKIIKNQLIRSVTSIPANIAEGYGGNKNKIYINSLTIARREATETDYWLLLSYELGYIDKEAYQEIESGYSEIRAMLTSIISKINKSSDF
jgi:four helix bundle protein